MSTSYIVYERERDVLTKRENVITKRDREREKLF